MSTACSSGATCASVHVCLCTCAHIHEHMHMHIYMCMCAHVVYPLPTTYYLLSAAGMSSGTTSSATTSHARCFTSSSIGRCLTAHCTLHPTEPSTLRTRSNPRTRTPQHTPYAIPQSTTRAEVLLSLLIYIYPHIYMQSPHALKIILVSLIHPCFNIHIHVCSRRTL